MNIEERPLVFDCAGDTLLGVLTVPEASTTDVGVLTVVGGPQYRAGSHRQFVLSARALAAGGVPVLRFDYRGMGDSSGAARSFEDVTDDIAAAIDAMQRALPGVRRVVLSGLCDGASAALMYWHATRDPRVCGFSLMNPWVRSEAGLVRAQVTHYYARRLREREFWLKLLSGKVALGALGEAFGKVRTMLGHGRPRAETATAGTPAAASYQQRMAGAWRQGPGPVLVVLSGRDLTAAEFLQHAASDPAWAGALTARGVTRHDLPDADHTLSAIAHRAHADQLALAWLADALPS